VNQPARGVAYLPSATHNMGVNQQTSGDADHVTNVVFAGIGGQGVITASDILADAAFRAGFDVKKAEIHGMSQRGGSVTSDVRFGRKVLSPMVPEGEADFLVVLSPDQIDNTRHLLRPGGVLLEPALIDVSRLGSNRAFNTAMLGVLSRLLTLSEDVWTSAIRAHLPEKVHEVNLEAFRYGRELAEHGLPAQRKGGSGAAAATGAE